MAKEQGRKLVAQNRKARYDYHIDDTFEAGLVLVGTEVKSLRAGRATLVDGFGEIHDGEAFLHGVHIPEYTQGTWTNHEPRRVRKLLLQPPRDRQAREPGQRARLHADPAVAVLQGRPRQGRDRAGPRQEDLRQAPRAGREAGQPREAAGARPPAQGHGLIGGWPSTSRSRRPAPSGRTSACPASSTSTSTSCRRTSSRRLGAVRPGRPEDRPGVADPLPRQPRGAGRAAPLLRRTTLLRAALRPPPGRRGLPQRLGARLRRRRARVPLVGDVLPRARGARPTSPS